MRQELLDNPDTCVARVAALLLVVFATAAPAATLTYPGAAPCNTTLQACVTGAASGDTIEIAQDALIAEFVDIDKSLTIQPAAGFAPQVQKVFTAVSDTSKTITVRDMAGGGGVRAVLGPGGGSLDLTVRGNTFANDSNPPIDVQTNFIPGIYGTVTINALDNALTVNQGFSSCVSAIVVVVTGPTTLNGRIIGNRITVNNLSQCGGIDAVAGAAGGGQVLIERNDIRGVDFDYGIVFRHFGANVGDPTFLFVGTIVNNLVVGQNGNTGAPAGIVLSADGNNAKLQGVVVNNTVALGRLGMLVSARTDLGATIEATIANNVVAFNSQRDIAMFDALPLVFNDHNLVTSIGDAFVHGPHTIVANPLFANSGGGDFRLAPDSPAIGRGRDSALDPAFTLDLAGAPRRLGPIDIGAYESGFAAKPEPVPVDAPLALALAGLLIAAFARRSPALRR